MHQHSSHHKDNIQSKNLLITFLLNLIISAAELIGGLLSNSLALISDAIHNFSDGLAVLITWFSIRISKRPANQHHTFGYKRVQILAALFNALTLITISIFLLVEAYHRFMQPQAVEGFAMMWVALIGLVANLLGVVLLRKFSKDNLNIKAAYLHLIGDSLSSMAVIIGGVLIIYYEMYWIDPLITALISLYILKETWEILAETYRILMQAGPSTMQLQPIADRVLTIEGVKSIHHIHIWQLTDQELHFEAHIEMKNDLLLTEAQKKSDEIRVLLVEEFGFAHVTLQTEFNRCCDPHLVAGSDHCNC